jgi:hypothetical protein
MPAHVAADEISNLRYSQSILAFTLISRCLGDASFAARAVREANQMDETAFNSVIEQAAVARKAGKEFTILQLAASLVEACRLIDLARAVNQRATVKVFH